ncbi:MAG: protein translocase subunit SecD [Deltaproteobacteria bacterium]|jgi:preprotein translocase subunit SecD|nr:protein translocase subunit SecD [Deltaproteobacteria bacterium]
MKQHVLWKIGLSLIVLIVSVIFLLPSFPAVKESSLAKILPDKQVNLGLDLMGGMYLALGVDVDKAVENSLTLAGEDIRQTSRENGIPVTRPASSKDGLNFILPDAAKRAELDALLAKQFNQFALERQSLADGSVRYQAVYTPEARAKLEETSLDLALNTIRNRIDQFGVAEPDIRKQSAEKRIIIQLPGLKDTKRAVDVIGKTAHLEFHVERELSSQDIERLNRGIMPAGAISLPMVGRSAGDGARNIIVDRDALFTGEYIEDAWLEYDNNNRPGVGMSFTSRGAAIFERVTAQNTGRNMAIVLDGQVHSAPVIREKISQGRASINGSFTVEEASDLALVLRAGSLPAPVEELERRTVGPSLGQESIDKGTMAALMGWGLVMAFVVIYYGFSGIIAAAMLLFDFILLLAGMAAFGATLTLPGIAGIVLTIGMAVDANVLIFERIREELKKGAAPRTAVELGFSRATVTILDSNLTTIIAAIILYQFGTGPVRGFAVTLTLGILASMFTAIFVSKAIFELWVTRKSTKISI